jgi:hypothetical protein
MDEIEVYRFAVWDRGRLLQSPNMATREAIRRAKGEADLESVRLVPASEVDSAGLYQGKSTSGPGVVRF